MRNLKKALSLALALVMLLGMMMVGAGAAPKFEDVPDGDANQEAVEVMNALEIILGDEGSKDFRPNDTLTRAEAAVIISKVHLTPALVAKLGAAETRFVDVAAYDGGWAARYVEACAVEQIILGDDDTHFAPERKVSGAEFAAMLLRVLGIDQGQFKNWPFDWQKAALQAGLDANGVDVFAEELSRAQAAQMAFNALKYSPSGERTYKVGNQTFDSAADAYFYQQGLTGEKPAIEVVTAKDSLAVTRFNLSEGSTGDAFGRTVKTWKVADKTVFTSATPVGAAASYVTGTNLKADAFDMAASVGVYVDSKDVTETLTSPSAIAINGYTGNGIQVDVYKNTAGEVNKIIVVHTALMQITRIAEKSVSLKWVAGTNLGVTSVGEKNGCFATLAGMEKDDYVLITAAKKDVKSVTVPDMVIGSVTKRVGGNAPSITMDNGKTYSFARDNGANAAVSKDVEIELYLDAYGNALYTKSVDSTTDNRTVFVTGFYTGVGEWGTTNMFQGVLADGTTITGTCEAGKTGPTIADGVVTAGGDAYKVYTYTVENGQNVLGGVASATAAGSASAAIASTDKQFNSGKYFAPDVKFIYVSGTKGSLQVTVREGVQAAENAEYYYVLGQNANSDDSLIIAVFLKTAPISDSSDIVYVNAGNDSNTQVKGNDGSKVWQHTVYIDGEKQTIVTGDQARASAGFYTYTIDETTGAYTLNPTAPTNIGSAVVEADDIALINGIYYLDTGFANAYDATDAIVVDFTGHDIVDTATLYEACKQYNVDVSVVADTTAQLYNVIYVTDSNKQAVPGEDIENVTETTTLPAVVGTPVETEIGKVSSELTVEANNNVTITGDVTGSVEVKSGATVTVEGKIKGEITVAGTGELVIDGGIDKDAVIKVDDLTKVSTTQGDKYITDGQTQGAVQLDTEFDASNLTNVSAGIPFYFAGVAEGGEGDQNYQDATVAVRFDMPAYNAAEGNWLIYKLVDENGKTYEKYFGGNRSASTVTAPFCIDHTGNLSYERWTEGNKTEVWMSGSITSGTASIEKNFKTSEKLHIVVTIIKVTGGEPFDGGATVDSTKTQTLVDVWVPNYYEAPAVTD